MSKLNLVPNEVVGYRLHPDQWNWKVVVVKRHGEESKNAGKEYESTLSYCKTIQYAIQYIVNHVSAMEGDAEQKKTFEEKGVAADLESLKVAFEKAEKAALWAVNDLEARLKESGFDLNKLGRGALSGDEVEVTEAEAEEE